MIHAYLEYAVTAIDVVGASILVLGFADSLLHVVWARITKPKSFLRTMVFVRCRLGTYLLLGLEFLIASDIITTVLEPTREELVAVALLVAIRTAIGYFLGKEMDEITHSSEKTAARSLVPPRVR